MFSLLSHKITALGKSLLFLGLVSLILSCVSETWGNSSDEFIPQREILLSVIDSHRQAGIAEQRTLLHSMFPERKIMTTPDSVLAHRAERGELNIASAAWWGWSGSNATEILQQAFSTRLDILVVPAMDGPWFCDPLTIDGPKQIIFEPGAELSAIEGGFHNQRESLVTLFRQSGVQMTGYGACLSMNRDDYSRKPYEWSQWRHALALLESQDIVIEGFTIKESGGDGVYVGQKKGGFIPRNIHLKDLYLLDNYRQGVSVISADGFLLDHCYISGTRGTPPMAAIDFEPNSGLYGLTACTVSRSLFEKNSGAALTIHLPNVSGYHPPVSISIEDSCILGYPLSAWIHGFGNGVNGRLSFSNCLVRGIGLTGRSKNFTISR